MDNLTELQKQYLDYIEHYITSNGFGPRYKEVAWHFDCCESNAGKHIISLIDHGYLKNISSKPRSLSLVHPHGQDKRIAMALLKIIENNLKDELHNDLVHFSKTDEQSASVTSAIFLVRQAVKNENS